MDKFYTFVDAAASGLSPAIVIPIVMLVVVLSSVAGLVIGIGRWKARSGYVNRIINTGSSRLPNMNG
jgi:hypothetical protein